MSPIGNVEEALTHLVDGNWPSELLQHSLKMSDQEREGLYSIAYDHYEANRIQTARAQFTYLATLNPFIQKHWIALGACDMCLNEWKEALNRFAIATLLEPEDPYPHYQAYLCYCQLNDNKEAKLALTEAYKRAKKHPLYSHLRQDIEKSLQEPLW